MVRGLDIFREYFKGYAGNYVIIGGTACSELIEDEGLKPRATKDIDAILIVEALSDEFVKRFWEFIRAGEYELWQTISEKTQFYRFIKPKSEGFPLQIELFSRVPDLIKVPEGSHLTPIPVGEDLSSLSAILLDDDYYHYATSHTVVLDDLNFVDKDAIVVLKAIAYINNSKRKAGGESVRSEDITKHKNDIFRITSTFTGSDRYEIPEVIKNDLRTFLEMIKEDGLGTTGLSKELGLGAEITIDEFTTQLKTVFGL
ncbi:hypothetical protein D0T49_00200 [Paludibacter sp. 221]|uniref:hypothetical protein n=1 Tax=Paludibacter sp. 221 TaxID=2302939 RepID=UPI0013CF47DF|nr:hypothetical protein [Paludibacter sp. 221]NDV45473.1 hypothetical protein [Paludibacter sp. 221]